MNKELEESLKKTFKEWQILLEEAEHKFLIGAITYTEYLMMQVV